MKTPLLFYRNPKRRKKELFFSVLIIVISVAAILFLASAFVYIFFGIFTFVGLYLLNAYAQNKPSVIVSEEGILCSVNGVGMISWEFVDGFTIKSGFNFEALVIVLKDQEVFFRDKNSMVKNLMKSNVRRFGSPAIIPETEFHVSLQNAMGMIENYRNS
ncbi:STM3941 family protein [uncultured Kordia sp.]|uniref:STM3941 family protein n=1 Tax=uncultured Kordia sp. TaxID=507699 RepID=UPI00260A88E3|nr:STM3941 family protein [uncultured Kordia sp.]